VGALHEERGSRRPSFRLAHEGETERVVATMTELMTFSGGPLDGQEVPSGTDTFWPLQFPSRDHPGFVHVYQQFLTRVWLYMGLQESSRVAAPPLHP
jgi:hypothetical protein